MKFSEKVYEVCKEIPKGKISTYKEIARKLKTKGYRAIGNALNKNPYKNVACWRVIKSDGFIGGFARGQNNKIKILKSEGINISKGKIINLKKQLYSFK
ncbi:MAG TPA: MGMT family protein [Candidatus Nanoarchaeia archaeon]|nr:MGMT family protein [Candidatus Nanoarchaeia archaeon]